MSYARGIALLPRRKHVFNAVILRILSRMFALRFHYGLRAAYFTRAPPAVVFACSKEEKKKRKKVGEA